MRESEEKTVKCKPILPIHRARMFESQKYCSASVTYSKHDEQSRRESPGKLCSVVISRKISPQIILNRDILYFWNNNNYSESSP